MSFCHNHSITMRNLTSRTCNYQRSRCKRNTIPVLWLRHTNLLFVLYILWITTTITASAELAFIPVHLQMREEIPINSVIGNIMSEVSLKLPAVLDDVINDQKSFFEVLPTGDVRVKRQIDRETLCGTYAKCCGSHECSLQAEVFIPDPQSGTSMPKAVRLFVNVTDENDERPRFEEAVQNVKVSELVPVDTTIALKPATDADVTPANKILRYVLEESSRTFTLTYTSDLTLLFLKVVKRLDFERQANYSAFLTACDISYCANQRISIFVQDENDNRPIFEKSEYTVTIPESINPLQRVVHVRANDADKNANGQVTYSLAVTPDADTMKTFILNGTTGDIFLVSGKTLSATVRKEYTLEIVATDAGKPPLTSSKAVPVIIRVTDVNDNAPEISVIGVADNKPILVRENKPAGSIAMLRVQDKDQDQNGRFRCRLEQSDHDIFRISPKSDEFYALETVRSLNYEAQSEYSIAVQCVDFGEPSLTSLKTLVIAVQDVNEFPPTFERSYYELKVRENLPSNIFVLDVKATDGDKSAILNYRIDGELGVRYFNIDSHTGKLETTVTPIDRETLEHFTFMVYVQDSEVSPIHTASCIIHILVVDENDNAPQFMTIPVYQLKENSPRSTLLGESLHATDQDVGLNAQIRYFLLHTYGSLGNSNLSDTSIQKLHNTFFHISESGDVTTAADIDRETHSHFILEVEAVDRGERSLFSVVNISVEVLDENDNPPIWISPPQLIAPNAVYNISQSNVVIGSVIFTLLAEDRDSGDNARIKYHMIKENAYFMVNSSTGQVVTRAELVSTIYTLHLQATDFGAPSLSSKITLTLNVIGHDMNYLNVLVIIILVSLTACIALVLLLTIVCIRRKPRDSREASPTLTGQDLLGENLLLTNGKFQQSHLPAWGCLPAAVNGDLSDTASATKLATVAGGIVLREDEVLPCDERQQLHPLMMAGATANLGTYYFDGDPYGRHHYEIDGESGDSGRGGSEHGDPSNLGAHQQLYSFDNNARPGRVPRGFGTLQRPRLSGPYHQGRPPHLQSRSFLPAPSASAFLSPMNAQTCYLIPADTVAHSSSSYAQGTITTPRFQAMTLRHQQYPVEYGNPLDTPRQGLYFTEAPADTFISPEQYRTTNNVSPSRIALMKTNERSSPSIRSKATSTEASRDPMMMGHQYEPHISTIQRHKRRISSSISEENHVVEPWRAAATSNSSNGEYDDSRMTNVPTASTNKNN